MRFRAGIVNPSCPSTSAEYMLRATPQPRAAGWAPSPHSAQADAEAGARIDISRIVQVLAKADPSPDGMLRGFRHTMLDDTDISATRHVRAAVGGMIASLIGCPAAFVSGGAEHQGPPGGGPVAVIARVSE